MVRYVGCSATCVTKAVAGLKENNKSVDHGAESTLLTDNKAKYFSEAELVLEVTKIGLEDANYTLMQTYK